VVAIHPRRLLTHDEVVSTCKKMAPLIRRRIADKPDRWPAGILVERTFGDPMGVYFLGCENHADQWRFSEPPIDHAHWLALFEQLGRLLSAHDVERGGERNYSLLDEGNGLPRQWLSIHRIEFLAPALVADIRALLRDGYSNWSVEVRLHLPFSDGVGPEGIDIWSDEIVEHWDRQHLKRRLGDRLKI
jgi:hypothetical protein